MRQHTYMMRVSRPPSWQGEQCWEVESESENKSENESETESEIESGWVHGCCVLHRTTPLYQD